MQKDPTGQATDILSAHPANQKRRKPKVTVESIEQLINLAYQKKGKPIPLSKSLSRKLGDAPPMADFERERLLTIAQKDINLAVARQLLVTAISLAPTNKLREILRCFVRDVLLKHPAFATDEIQAFVRNFSDSIEPSRALELILVANYPLAEDLDGKKGDAKTEMNKRRKFVAACFAVWLVLTKKMPPKIVLKLLYPAVLKPETDKIKGEGRRVSQMFDLTDPARVAVACSAYEELLNEEASRADTAARIYEAEARKVLQLSSDLKKAEDRIANQDIFIRELEELIEEEKNKARTEALHYRDDYEKLRGRVLRCLKSETTLLDEGLQALRRTPPKAHVMLDHADRAIGNLKNEIRNLESEGKR